MAQDRSVFPQDAKRVRKVLAYITRDKDGKTQLLVFTHRDEPVAGLQVPAGTVDEGEQIEDALFREVEEETGLPKSALRLVRRVAVYDYFNEEKWQIHERHVYHLEAVAPTAEHWDWYETDGGKKPIAQAHCFQYSWLDLESTIKLAGNEGEWLHILRG